jgi:hypothetical protein
MPFQAPQSAQLQRQTIIPITGQTIVMADTSEDGAILMDPAGTLAAITITMPTSATAPTGRIRQRRIATSKAITILSFSVGVTVMGAPASLALGDCINLVEMTPGVWYIGA